MRMCSLSYAQIGGKAANADLPPLKTAEKLQVQDFLHSERRKTCRCSFTAAGNDGKAAGAPRAHHLSGTQLLGPPNGIHVEGAIESGRSRILLQLTGNDFN
ncbi:hypothetical protein AAC387_Pa07g3501 [Persea americana]